MKKLGYLTIHMPIITAAYIPIQEMNLKELEISTNNLIQKKKKKELRMNPNWKKSGKYAIRNIQIFQIHRFMNNAHMKLLILNIYQKKAQLSNTQEVENNYRFNEEQNSFDKFDYLLSFNSYSYSYSYSFHLDVKIKIYIKT